MSLPIFQTDSKDLSLLQTGWAQQLNPVINNPISQGILINNVKLNVGNNTINHRLSRKLQGYIVIGMRGAFTQIYQTASLTPQLTLVLNSSAVATVDLYVF